MSENPHQGCQIEHTPLLSVGGDLVNLTDESVPVDSGWTERYGCWWEEQLHAQQMSKIFSVRLVGDEADPKQFTSLALNDLAQCRHVVLDSAL